MKDLNIQIAIKIYEYEEPVGGIKIIDKFI